MQIDEQLIRNVVAQVLAEVGAAPPIANGNKANQFGVFNHVDDAVAAASEAFVRISQEGLSVRKRAVDQIRRICREHADELGAMELEETKIGRLEHKIGKLHSAADLVPGVEMLKSEVFSGDFGLAVIEHAPFGVIGAITPVTHSLPTLAGNAINMIAAGNTVVVNPHPSGKNVAVEGVRRFNQSIYREIGIDNLITIIANPTIESANQIFNHRDVALICVTGGALVAKAALGAGKRAIVAGPGNPPVVVDETADLDRAARCIIEGASFDNNLLCIAEKEIFVVESVADAFKQALSRNGAVELKSHEIQKLTAQAIRPSGDDNHLVAAKEFIGQDASKLAEAAGRSVASDVQLLFGETDATHPFVSVEQMMPFVPVVRCRNVEEAIQLAKRYEHGFRHTSIIHSNNVNNMTRMGQILDTTLFVKNGSCLAALGVGGEGYLSYSIAGPTGEGVTTPLTFTRERRCSLVENLRIVGKPK
jgi:aldehyde dehydrogenase